jgi:predicted HicB family RNase H-like nuclease
MPDEQKKDTQRVNLFLDPDVVLKGKMQALKERISLSQLVDKALDKYIRKAKK